MIKLNRRNRAAVAQVLDGAIALLSKRGGWIQDSMARNRKGEACSPDSPSAVCFCAIGAMVRARGKFSRRRLEPGTQDAVLRDSFDLVRSLAFARKRKSYQIPGASIPAWNDAPNRTKRQVLAVFRRARKELDA